MGSALPLPLLKTRVKVQACRLLIKKEVMKKEGRLLRTPGPVGGPGSVGKQPLALEKGVFLKLLLTPSHIVAQGVFCWAFGRWDTLGQSGSAWHRRRGDCPSGQLS